MEILLVQSLVLCACLVTAPVHAQLNAAQARGEYFEIKRKVAEVYSQSKPDKFENVVVVFDCGFTEGLDFIGVDAERNSILPDWALYMFTLAKGVVQLRRAAAMSGYPEGSWKAQLVDFEDVQLRQAIFMAVNDKSKKEASPLVGAPYPENIVDAMNDYRKRRNPKLPELISQDGCGAGESPVLIKGSPPAARLLLVPEFFASICERGGRFSKIEACPYWREAQLEVELPVSGLYRYAMSWADGSSRQGRIDFDKYAKPGKIVSVTIPK